MVKDNKTSDNSIRWMILGGELLALNAALLTMSFIYQSMGNITTPHYKRLMLLMTLVYVLCDLQNRYRIHDRFVRGDQLLRSFIQSMALFTLLSLMVMWGVPLAVDDVGLHAAILRLHHHLCWPLPLVIEASHQVVSKTWSQHHERHLHRQH